MTTIFQIILPINALFFLLYGLLALRSQMMIEEFKRFGLSDNQRKLTGLLQIFGSIGLLTGFLYLTPGLLASAGFTVMMLVAFSVRVKIKDSILQSAPALFFLLVNLWLTITFYNLMQ